MTAASLRTLFRRSLTRFVVVGAGANLLLLVLSYLFRRLGMPAFAAGVTGYAIAFLAAYAAQRSWTFSGTHSHWHAFPRYLAAQIACAVLAGLVGHLCVALLAASPFWMSVAVTLTAALGSYLLSSRWVFAGHR